MFNFQSLTEAITTEQSKTERGAQCIEDVAENSDVSKRAPINGNAALFSANTDVETSEPLGESVMTLKSTQRVPELAIRNEDEDDINPTPRLEVISHDHSFDQKHVEDISMVDRISHHHATQ